MAQLNQIDRFKLSLAFTYILEEHISQFFMLIELMSMIKKLFFICAERANQSKFLKSAWKHLHATCFSMMWIMYFLAHIGSADSQRMWRQLQVIYLWLFHLRAFGQTCDPSHSHSKAHTHHHLHHVQSPQQCWQARGTHERGGFSFSN